MSFSTYETEKLIEYLPEALFLEDSEGNILDVNSKACHLLGYEKEELVDLTVNDLVPEDAPAFLPGRIDESTRNGKPLETTNVRKDGTKIPVELRGRVVEVEGEKRILVSIRDISARKAEEEKLKQFQRAVEASDDLMAGFDLNQNYLFANSAYREFYRVEKEDILDKKLEDLIKEERYRNEVKPRVKKCLQGEKVEYEMKRTHPGQGERLLKILYYPLYRGEEVRGGVAVMRDITKEKKMEEELQFESQLLNSLLENIPDTVYFKNEKAQFIRVSKSKAEQVGEDSREDLHGKTDFDYYSGEEAKEAFEDDMQVIQEEEPVINREERYSEDGNTYWMEATKVPRYDQEGNVVGLLGISRNITERKEAERELKKSEERLKLALEGTQAGLWDWKVQTGEVMFDERWAEMVGYTLEELQPISTQTWRELAHPEDLEKSEELLDKHFKGETDYYNCEVRMKHKSGDWVWVLTRGRVVEWDDEGEPIRMVGTHQDITERKEAEQALQDERDKLKNLHDAVDEMQQQDTEEDVLRTAVDVAETMLDFRFCDVSLIEGDYLVPKASATGLDSEESVPFEMGEGITGKTMQKGDTIWGEDVQDHPDAKPTSGDFRAFISVPIGELGVFQVISEEVDSFTERDVELAEVLVGHLREELMRVRLEEELREQAIHDPLTGLYNRRYFNETLGKEVERCRRYDEALAFLMLDVDRFKEVNDRYTHQTGDEVLQEVADLLEENVRDADTVVRYGGDEFLIMMPETEKVESTVNRIEEELKVWNEESDLLDFPLTLAKGSARWNPDQERGAEEALKEADKKMYEEKDR